MLKKLIVSVLLLAYTNMQAVANPEPRCPCFSAMFAAGACQKIVNIDGKQCGFNSSGVSFICPNTPWQQGEVTWSFFVGGT